MANLPRAIASALVRRDNHDNTIIEERRLTSRLSFCDMANPRLTVSPSGTGGGERSVGHGVFEHYPPVA